MTLTILFILLIAEFSYRLFFKPKAAVSIMECGENCYQHDSLLGFRPAIPGNWKGIEIAPGGDTIIDIRYTVMTDTSKGLKYDRRIGYMGASNMREFVFVGCCFTFGSTIDDSATLPWQFGKITNASTVNLGCSAYGLH